MMLTMKEAPSGHEEAAWPTYSSFVRSHLFDGGPDRRARDEWIETAEKENFCKYWSSSKTYSIDVDGEAIGWAIIFEADNRIVVENLHLIPEWQHRGAAEKIFGGLIPRWLDAKKVIEVPILKHAKSSHYLAKMLINLGFKVGREDTLFETLQLV